jgi:thiamine pyrophosphokinase
LIVGDFDSCDAEALRMIGEWQAAGSEVRTYRHDTKLETDTELALLAAADYRPDRIYLLGATGGRLDHTLANILLLTHPALSNIDVRIVEGKQEVYLAKPGIWNAIDGTVGDTVSLLPVGREVTSAHLHGLRYPLDGETLLPGRGRGVSNEVAGGGAAVRFERGQLLVSVSHT